MPKHEESFLAPTTNSSTNKWKADYDTLQGAFEVLDTALEQSQKQVTAIDKQPALEHAFEKQLAHVNALDSPRLRFVAGCLQVNSWELAYAEMDQMGERAGLIGLLRAELRNLLWWVVDPLLA